MKVKEVIASRTLWIPSKTDTGQQPKVSILFPTANQTQFGLFEKAVQAVLNQTFPDFELIIIDDASTDGTFELIQRFMAEDPRVNCIRHVENIGLPAISEYEGYLRSRGIYFAFMFDGNEWEVNGLEQLVNYAEQNGVKAVAGKYLHFNGEERDKFEDNSKWTQLGGSEFELDTLLVKNGIANGAVLIHRDVIETIGFYDPNIVMSHFCDWDLWLRIAKNFRFDMVDFLIGKEKACKSFEPVEDAHGVFYWAVIERMNQPRNNSLIPNNLGECDIYMSSFPCSSYFFRCMYLLLEPFTNKSWFRMPERTESSEKPITIKRITYIAGVDFSTINASTTITWGRLSYSERRLIYFTTLECIRYADLLFSDAIVLWEHGLVFYCDQIINWAKQYRIPCFSYVDDNFIALSEDCSNFQINDGGVSNYLAKRMNENYSKYYSGVFFSSPHLLSFFTNRGLLEPQKSFLIQPIHEKALYTKFNPIENEVNILYFGGDFRKEIISKVIIPVLKQITTDKNVNFYCPEDVFKFLIDGKYHHSDE